VRRSSQSPALSTKCRPICGSRCSRELPQANDSMRSTEYLVLLLQRSCQQSLAGKTVQETIDIQLCSWLIDVVRREERRHQRPAIASLRESPPQQPRCRIKGDRPRPRTKYDDLSIMIVPTDPAGSQRSSVRLSRCHMLLSPQRHPQDPHDLSRRIHLLVPLNVSHFPRTLTSEVAAVRQSCRDSDLSCPPGRSR